MLRSVAMSNLAIALGLTARQCLMRIILTRGIGGQGPAGASDCKASSPGIAACSSRLFPVFLRGEGVHADDRRSFEARIRFDLASGFGAAALKSYQTRDIA
jgi:hypothetical protein